MPSRPISSQTKDTEDNVVDPNPACNTLIHFTDPVVNVESVRFVWGSPAPNRPPVNTISMFFKLDMKVYCICETLSCETACTTSTPGPLDFSTDIIVQLEQYMSASEYAELKKWSKEGKFDKTVGNDLWGPGTVLLDDLLDTGFTNNDYVNNPRDANDWFGPVTDAVKSQYGNYTRPNGKDSVDLNEYLAGGPKSTMEGWNFLFGMTKPCTCQRIVTHTNQVSDRTFEFPESRDD